MSEFEHSRWVETLWKYCSDIGMISVDSSDGMIEIENFEDESVAHLYLTADQRRELAALLLEGL